MTQTSGASRREIMDARLQRCLKIEIGNFSRQRRLRIRPASEFAEAAPHPSPLPAKGGAREK
jgi:hypothetical protein